MNELNAPCQPAQEDRVLFRLGVTAFVAVLFLGFTFYRISGVQFRDNLNIPVEKVAGFDFGAYYVFATDFVNGRSPYLHDTRSGPNPYPPLYTVFCSPITLGSFRHSYLVWTVLSLGAYLVSIRMAMLFDAVPRHALVIFVTAAFLLSQTYPVPFVWERGTPEFFILLIMAGGLLLLIRQKYFWAMICLAIATHFKLYPLILGSFILLRGRWKWAAGFTALVAALFFVLGVKQFKNFLWVISYTMREPERWIWEGNHSLKSFSILYDNNPYISPFVAQIAVLVTSLALVAVFLWVMAGAFRQKRSGRFSAAEVCLLGMAFTLMTLLPTFSHDYKLAQQFFPLLLLLLNGELNSMASRSRKIRILTVILSALVGTLFIPRLGDLPKTPSLVLVFIVYVVLANFSLDMATSSVIKPAAPRLAEPEPTV